MGSSSSNWAFVLGQMKTMEKGWPVAKASECSPVTKQAEKTLLLAWNPSKQLTPCGTIILEEKWVSQLVRKAPAFYGARKFHKRLPPVLLLTQMNPVHIHTTSWALPCLCLCSRQGCVSMELFPNFTQNVMLMRWSMLRFLTAWETQYTKHAHRKKQLSTIWSELTWTVKVTLSPSGQSQNCNHVAYFKFSLWLHRIYVGL